MDDQVLEGQPFMEHYDPDFEDLPILPTFHQIWCRSLLTTFGHEESRKCHVCKGRPDKTCHLCDDCAPRLHLLQTPSYAFYQTSRNGPNAAAPIAPLLIRPCTWLPLIWPNLAVAHGDTYSVVKLLLESLAPDERLKYLMAKDKWGRTALHLAAMNGHTNTVKVLLKSIAHDKRLEYLKAKDKWGWTALHWAAECGWAAHKDGAIKYILETAEPHERLDLLSGGNQNNDTPLLLMAKKHSSEVICQVLSMLTLSQRSDCMKLQGKDGQTVLHALSANRQKADQSMLGTALSLTGRFAAELLKITNSDSKTPADVAETGNIKELLIRRFKAYNLNKAPHVIIYYTTFDRPSALQEMTPVLDACTSIGIQPDMCKDFFKDDALIKIKNACSQQDLSALIVFFMAHGNAYCIGDQQGQPLDMQEIITAMSEPSLHSVPKVLIMQACRGPMRELPGNNVAVSSEATFPCSSAPVSGSITNTRVQTFHLPARDFLVMYSSLPGVTAQQNVFIPILAKHIQEEAVDEDLYTVVCKTAQVIRQQSIQDQAIELHCTLSRRLCIGGFVPIQ